jgi:hypothetical protein
MKSGRSLRYFLIIAFIGQSAIYAYPKQKPILRFAGEYSISLGRFQKGKSGESLESLLNKGMKVSRHLNEIESLSDGEYTLLKKRMHGFVVNREEVLFINPDLKFFSKLAKSHGKKADIDFFALMRKIRPDNIWAQYIEQQTDATGCTIYGNGSLTKLYGEALRYKKVHPGSYKAEVDKEIEEILSQFLAGTCACGSQEDALKEFRLFLQSFPSDKNAPAIRKRMQKITKNQDFRFDCQSG